MTSIELDLRVAALAASQHNVFSRQQVIAAGGTQSMIRRRCANGRWTRLDDGVYALAGPRPTWKQKARASTIAHPAARVGSVGAAVLHGFDGFAHRRPKLEILVPRGANHRSTLATVRESKHLSFATVDGIPVVSAAHAFFSLLPTLGEERAKTVLEEGFRHDVLTPDELMARVIQIERSRYPGIRRVREIADAYGTGGPVIGRSVLERKLHEMLAEPGMPSHVLEAPPPWRTAAAERVDVLLADVRVIIEADGRRWHDQRRDMAKDLRRNNLAAMHGYLVLHLMWTDIVLHPESGRQQILDTYATALATQLPLVPQPI